jgi:hypothetical protein
MNGRLVIIKDVAGDVCENYGHFYINSNAAITMQYKVAKALEYK